MILVDTGYFIALLDFNDDLHSRAAAWASNLRDRLLVTEYVLVETVNRLSRPMQRPRAHELAAALKRHSQYHYIPASTRFLESGLAYHKRHADKEWSLTDCISFHLMEERGIKRALAYDRHFEQAGFEALLRRDPS